MCPRPVVITYLFTVKAPKYRNTSSRVQDHIVWHEDHKRGRLQCHWSASWWLVFAFYSKDVWIVSILVSATTKNLPICFIRWWRVLFDCWWRVCRVIRQRELVVSVSLCSLFTQPEGEHNSHGNPHEQPESNYSVTPFHLHQCFCKADGSNFRRRGDESRWVDNI